MFHSLLTPINCWKSWIEIFLINFCRILLCFGVFLVRAVGPELKFQTLAPGRGGSMGWPPPLKPARVTLFAIMLTIRKQHSRFKAILSSTVLWQQCCEAYYISFAQRSRWDLNTKCYWISPLTLLARSAPGSRHLKFLDAAPAWFGPLKTDDHGIICTTRLSHRLGLRNYNPNIGLQLTFNLNTGYISRTMKYSRKLESSGMTGEIFLAPGAGRMMSTLKLRIQKAEILIEW